MVAHLLDARRPGATWLEHVMIRNREAAREQIDRMLTWDIDRIAVMNTPTGGHTNEC